jgi:hypothetical protein
LSLQLSPTQPEFDRAAAEKNLPIYTAPRSSPEYVGSELLATHSVIRINSVTGWKPVFAVGHHLQHINSLTKEKSTSTDWIGF